MKVKINDFCDSLYIVYMMLCIIKCPTMSDTGVTIGHRALCVQTTIRSEVIRVVVPPSTYRSSTTVMVCCLLIHDKRSRIIQRITSGYEYSSSSDRHFKF